MTAMIMMVLARFLLPLLRLPTALMVLLIALVFAAEPQSGIASETAMILRMEAVPKLLWTVLESATERVSMTALEYAMILKLKILLPFLIAPESVEEVQSQIALAFAAETLFPIATEFVEELLILIALASAAALLTTIATESAEDLPFAIAMVYAKEPRIPTAMDTALPISVYGKVRLNQSKPLVNRFEPRVLALCLKTTKTKLTQLVILRNYYKDLSI
jgi:hypothetical protein